ncbi:NAD-dependent glycerol-3-phosphate dehydrogenase C-terminus family protein [Acanthocheilonema viteae]
MKHKSPAKITLIGSGSWGSTIALIIGRNAEKYRNDFDPKIRMWVHEEVINEKKLTEIINTQHENVKYLPVSEKIRELLNIDTAVLMGANVAQEVANDEFSEATIGYKGQKDKWQMLKKLFESDNFRIHLTEDSNTVELCGGLKNIVACAAGFADGLGYGSNTKAAIIRLGLLEIISFIELFYHSSNIQTYFESCGIADLIVACTSGRNRKICEAFVKTKKSIQDLECEILNGQNVQGPATAEAIFVMLKKHNMISKFPLFIAVYQICREQLSPNLLIARLRECKGELPKNWLNGQQFFTR